MSIKKGANIEDKNIYGNTALINTCNTPEITKIYK